ncbi:Propanediol dehydratase medium subunit [Escherichia coli]|nr:Propanediol dehydratase medium subunit [Escherichia coli]VWM73980.1 Propanediol dehydratase medium subunit [Escherichia coli]
MQQTTQIQPSFTLKTREGGVASADERADEVVIGVGPAFDKHQHHTLIDMPHGAILKELIAGVEEEGLHAISANLRVEPSEECDASVPR